MLNIHVKYKYQNEKLQFIMIKCSEAERGITEILNFDFCILIFTKYPQYCSSNRNRGEHTHQYANKEREAKSFDKSCGEVIQNN